MQNYKSIHSLGNLEKLVVYQILICPTVSSTVIEVMSISDGL